MLTLLGLVISCVASAADDDDTRVYRWKDAEGSKHYGDYVPPEYAGARHTVLNEQGIEIESVAGNLSEAERAANAKQAEKEAAVTAAAHEAAIRDKILLNTYLSVAEIEALRDRRIELLGGQIRLTERYLENLRKKLAKLEREANRYSPYSTKVDAPPIDEKLARELSETLNSIHLYEMNLDKSREEQVQTELKFAADIRRFTELKGITNND